MVETAKEWFTANGGIKNKATRETVMMFDSKDLSGTGYYLKIIDRGRMIIQEQPYLKEFRRTVRHSKEIRRKRNV
jgi:hypothetical protein